MPSIVQYTSAVLTIPYTNHNENNFATSYLWVGAVNPIKYNLKVLKYTSALGNQSANHSHTSGTVINYLFPGAIQPNSSYLFAQALL